MACSLSEAWGTMLFFFASEINLQVLRPKYLLQAQQLLKHLLWDHYVTQRSATTVPFWWVSPMADVRALLKAKRQEVRITHPLATYTRNGQLRCVPCGTIIKHASSWEGHLGSKAHRTNVVRVKEAERLREEMGPRNEKEKLDLERIISGKRKLAEDQSESDTQEGGVKKRRLSDATGASNSFPTDFFSDLSRAPLPPASDESGGEDDDDDSKPLAPTTASDNPVLDLEWERFQRDVLDAPNHHETYERATVFAEPELASETPEGFPSQQIEEATFAAPNKIDDEEARQKKEKDERELIMDRLLDEERAQEEADMKVAVMKNRLDALKRRREAARATKTEKITQMAP